MINEIPEERETRFNDVIADPEGRVFCGTMPTQERPGRLYRLDTDGTLHMVIDKVGISNGMGFTADLRCMYFTDSPTLNIYRFDYDRETGDIANRVVFTKAAEDEGIPDGMTVDAHGCIWSARWDGHCLVRYTPDGVEERRIAFPVRKVSSLTFGGEDCKDIYVTTAGGNIKHEDGEHAGALFRLNLGIRGVEEFYSQDWTVAVGDITINKSATPRTRRHFRIRPRGCGGPARDLHNQRPLAAVAYNIGP